MEGAAGTRQLQSPLLRALALQRLSRRQHDFPLPRPAPIQESSVHPRNQGLVHCLGGLGAMVVFSAPLLDPPHRCLVFAERHFPN